jgi:hypothetical protein
VFAVQWPAAGGRQASAVTGNLVLAEPVELVVQPLLGHLAVGDQPAPIADRGQQHPGAVVGGWPTGA